MIITIQILCFDTFIFSMGRYSISDRLRGVSNTVEFPSNLNNSMKKQKKSKRPEDTSIGTRRSCFMKKNGIKKSRDTVPLMVRTLIETIANKVPR